MKPVPCALVAAAVLFAATGYSIPSAKAQSQYQSTLLSGQGNTAVNNVEAQKYMMLPKDSASAYQANPNTVVNFGSAAKGTCNMTIGGVPDPANPSQTVVAAKNIVNVCGQ